jgi:hypothetical protein
VPRDPRGFRSLAQSPRPQSGPCRAPEAWIGIHSSHGFQTRSSPRRQ